MNRSTIAAAFLVAAAVCFLLVLASIWGDDFHVDEPAFLAGGFFLTTLALIAERVR